MNKKGKSAIQKLKDSIKKGDLPPSRPTSKQLTEWAMTKGEWDTAARESQDRARRYKDSPLEDTHRNNAKSYFGRKP